MFNKLFRYISRKIGENAGVGLADSYANEKIQYTDEFIFVLKQSRGKAYRGLFFLIFGFMLATFVGFGLLEGTLIMEQNTIFSIIMISITLYIGTFTLVDTLYNSVTLTKDTIYAKTLRKKKQQINWNQVEHIAFNDVKRVMTIYDNKEDIDIYLSYTNMIITLRMMYDLVDQTAYLENIAPTVLFKQLLILVLDEKEQKKLDMELQKCKVIEPTKIDEEQE